MATPILQDLKERWPQAKLTAMCQSNISPLLKCDPYLDELFSFQCPIGWLHRQQSRDLVRTLRHGAYELGILLTNSLSSAVWFWRGHVKKRVGFGGNLRSPLLTHPIDYPKNKENLHQVLVYKKLIEAIGVSLSDTRPHLYVTNDELREAKETLTRYRVPYDAQIVGVNPGAAFGSAKCWPPQRFIEVTQKLLSDPNIFVFYFGDAAGQLLVSHICENMPERVVNLAGKTTLRGLMALIQQFDVLLTNDSGPMHIAAALEIPLLALFGSTNEMKTGPYLSGDVIKKQGIPCAPCYLRVCPIDFRCMTEISADDVYSKIKKLLNKCPSKT